MTINVAETIRKVMGWCPNAATIEAKKSVQFDDFAVNTSDKSGKSNDKAVKWWNKYHNLILIISVLGTLSPINMFVTWEGMNIGSLLAGAFLGLLISVLMRKSIYSSLNRIETRTFRKNAARLSAKKIIVFGISIFLYMLAFIHFAQILGLMGVVSFHGGFGLPLLWSLYIQIIQWERKNQKTLVKLGYVTPITVVLDKGT